MKVAEIMAAKRKAATWVKPTETILALTRVLREHHVGAAVVSSDGVQVEGMVSERDIAYNLATRGPELLTMPVSAVMTRKVISCTPNDHGGAVASLMLSHSIRHIPVVGDGKLVGMVSIRDVLGMRVGELQQETAMLRTLVNDASRMELQDRD